MENQTKNMFLFLLCILMIYSMFLLQRKPEESLQSSDFIRFHVIAASNLQRDQELKLKVRDKVLADITPKLMEMETIEESRNYIIRNLAQIRNIAEAVIRKEGFDYGVNVRLGQRFVPQKTYGTITFPAGNYEALNIEIGKAEGENWWCVLFPPLCLMDENAEGFPEGSLEASEDEIEKAAVLGEKYKNIFESREKNAPLTLKFKTAELFQKKTAKER